MRIKKAFYCSVFCALTLPVLGETNHLCEQISSVIRQKLQSIVVPNPSAIIRVEGIPSSTYSSINHQPDYFLIPIANANGGRILKMKVLTVDQTRGWWYGIEDTNIVFTDVINGEVFSVPLTTVASPDNLKLHFASFTLDNREFYIEIHYGLSNFHYPVVTLTWGRGATYNDTGTDIDDLTCVLNEPVLVPANSVRKVTMMREVASRLHTKAYLIILDRPLHAKHLIQYNTSKTNWISIPQSAFYMNEASNELIVRSSTLIKKFRLINQD